MTEYEASKLANGYIELILEHQTIRHHDLADSPAKIAEGIAKLREGLIEKLKNQPA